MHLRNRLKMTSQSAAIIMWLVGSVLGLRDIQLSVPEAVGIGSSAILGCRWSLDVGETLYTVKWYHGAQEFFRFVPKEMPNTRVFSQMGINVDVSRSGAHQVVLRDATRSLAGRYRCEVSADAPFFHTVYKTALLRVAEFPETQPKIRAQKSWYSVGDMLRANCSSSPSDPPANISWFVNEKEVRGLNIPVQDQTQSQYKKPSISDMSLEDANRIIFTPWIELPIRYDSVTSKVTEVTDSINVQNKDGLWENKNIGSDNEQMSQLNISSEEEKSNKSSSFSQLVMRVQPVHFIKGHMNVTCVARVLSVWSASGVLILDEERPQIAPVMGSRDSNSGLRLSVSLEGVLISVYCVLHWHRSPR